MRVLLDAALLMASATAGVAEDVNAGPIRSNLDAQNKCPAVCTSHGRSWNGNWRTTVFGQMSTCSCGR